MCGAPSSDCLLRSSVPVFRLLTPPPRAAVTITLWKLALIFLLASCVSAQKKRSRSRRSVRPRVRPRAPPRTVDAGRQELPGAPGQSPVPVRLRHQRSKAAISLDEIDAAAVRRADEGPAIGSTGARPGSMQLSASGKELLYIAAATFSWSTWTQGNGPDHQDPRHRKGRRLAPDGKTIAFRRGSDLYAVDVASKSETRLTRDGADTLRNGGSTGSTRRNLS